MSTGTCVAHCQFSRHALRYRSPDGSVCRPPQCSSLIPATPCSSAKSRCSIVHLKMIALQLSIYFFISFQLCCRYVLVPAVQCSQKLYVVLLSLLSVLVLLLILLRLHIYPNKDRHFMTYFYAPMFTIVVSSGICSKLYHFSQLCCLQTGLRALVSLNRGAASQPVCGAGEQPYPKSANGSSYYCTAKIVI